MQLPLQSVLAVEIGSSVAAPFASRILADMGAQVLKIEAPKVGDPARRWGPPFWGDAATIFHAFNRGKLSVELDLKNDDHVRALSNFIDSKADIVLQNLRPGLIAEYALDADTLRKRKPSLVYCNMGAFGDRGPMRSFPGYDPLIQASAGLISMTGEKDRPPVRLGAPVVDMGTGMWAVIGMLAALHKRNETGEGSTVDVSLYDTAIGWGSLAVAEYQTAGMLPPRRGLGGPTLMPNGGFQAMDGILMLTIGTDAQFRSLCKVIEAPQLADDKRFSTNVARRENERELTRLLEDAFSGRPRDHWFEELSKLGIPAAPVRDIAEVCKHPQTQAMELLQECEGDGLQLVGIPIRIEGQRPKARGPAPALGSGNHLLDLQE